MQKKQKKFITIITFVLIMLSTFAYSALATNLSITGEANFRVVSDIRVTNIGINGASGATSEYETFKKDTITTGFVLNNTSSTMTYNVTITNNGTIDEAIYDLTTVSSNNAGLTILIDGQPINSALPMIVPFGTSKTITVTYSSSIPGRVAVTNQFDFRKVYYITYNLKGGTSSDDDLNNNHTIEGRTYGQIKYENVALTLSNSTPTKQGSTFTNWNTANDGTGTNYSSGDAYTENSNKILYAVYNSSNYTITIDADGGTIPSTSGWTITSDTATKDISAGSQIGTLPTPTKTGYTFDGWFDSHDNEITSSTVPSSSTTYTAHWTANELTFNNETLNQGTYGNSYTSDAFTSASNGTGNYTYTIQSGAPTGATINSANRTITFTNSTNAGIYNVVVRATDDDSQVYKDATMTIVINKATPIITLDSNSGTINAGATQSVVATVISGSSSSVAGTLTASSSNTDVATVAPTSSSITATSQGVDQNTVITGVAGGTATISYNFTPTDTTNFNSAAVQTYTVTGNNKVTITIKKDGSTWSDSGKTVKLYQLGVLKYTLTTSGSSATAYGIAQGAYNVYATKSSLDSEIVYTGVNINIGEVCSNDLCYSQNKSGTINYYTLTLNKDSNTSSVSGAGVYLSNQSASIEATPNIGYEFSSWTVNSGNTPASTTAASTTVSMSQATQLTASSTLNIICKRASTLNTETCPQTSTSNYCSDTKDGEGNGNTIAYGNLGVNNSTLNAGDAFDCKVTTNGDYTERFYYVSDYYDTSTNTTNSDYAVLVYYNNVSGGVANNSTAYAYDSSGENWHGPVTAAAQLPTTSQWSNISLYKTNRQILTQTNTTSTSGGDLPVFDYSNYAARLLTYQEVYNGCYDNTTAITSMRGLSSKCKFLMENTKYSSSSLATYGPWLETPYSSSYTTVWNATSTSRYVNTTSANVSNRGVRPVIEVPKASLNKTLNKSAIVFSPNGGTGTMNPHYYNPNATINIDANTYTRSGYTFIGWNTKPDGTGDAYLDEESVTLSDTLRLYAQWIQNGSVTITGDNVIGETLSASVTPPIPAPTSYTYQWYRGSTAINGATSSTYTTVAADIGETIKVVVTANYSNYSSVTLEDTTDATNNISATTLDVFSSNGVALIEGTAAGPSGVLTATVTTAPTPTPDSYTYQWYRGNAAISGATSSTYTTVAADVNETIKVVITAVKSGYKSISFNDTIDETNNKSDTIINVRAVDVYYDNTNTGMTCETAQCALDNIARMLKRSDAPGSTGNSHLCRRAAASELHTETCSQVVSGMYCYGDGYYASGKKGTTTITYGSTGTSGTLTTGDAFICDVNGDGSYDSEEEMFYYVSDYYDTSSTSSNSDYATLVYYNNVSAGEPSNSAAYAYDSSGENWHGPVTAITQLPDTLSWQDVGLYKNTRAILAEKLTTHNSTTTSGGTLPTAFSYKGYSSRLITAQEIMNACEIADGEIGLHNNGELSECNFLFENTAYSNSSLTTSGIWFETPNESTSTSVWFGDTNFSWIGGVNVNSSNYGGVRPVIEVKKSDLNLNLAELVTISFNANGGTGSMSNQTVAKGQNERIKANTFTKTNYVFKEWNTEFDGSGTSYNDKQSVSLNSNTTLYAQWTPTYTVTFEANGGSGSMNNQTITSGVATNLTANSFIRTNYNFTGWNTESNGSGTSYNDKQSVSLNSNTTLYAQWTPIVCKRVTSASELHTETCSQTSTSSYCSNTTDGEGTGKTITYGNAKANGQPLATGDAFDCKVTTNGDYTERFYYVSDYYDTSTNTTNGDYAVLIYYNNVSGGAASNSTKYSYDSSKENWHGPVTAAAQLPTTSQWSNISLYKTNRQILTQANGTSTAGGDLPVFDYSDYAARLLTYQEIYNGCYDNTTSITLTGGLSSKCKFLFENTKYSKSSLKTYGSWLETPRESVSDMVYDVYSSNRGVANSTANNTNFGVRPVIEVSKSKLSY